MTLPSFDCEKALRSAVVTVALKGNSKPEIIAELVDALVKGGCLAAREPALQSVLDREAKMSTGMQYGVAVPHGKIAEMTGLVSAIGLKPEGVDFHSLDGSPSRIFVLVVSSITETAPHMQYLGQIGRALSCPAVRDKLLQARTREEVIEVLLEP